MMYEFFSFEAYEAACARDTGLLGFFPTEAAVELGRRLRNLSRAVRAGSLDVVRVYRDGSFHLYITLGSMHRFHSNPDYIVAPLPRWQVLLFQSDQVRGAWVRAGLG